MKTRFFEYDHTDEWGVVFVVCPVCDFDFKLDGVKKHIINKCKVNDLKHCRWIRKHRLGKGPPSPFIPSVQLKVLA